MYDLLRILPLRPQPGLIGPLQLQCVDQTSKTLPPAGHIAVLILMIPPEIKTHHPAFIRPLQKAASAVRKILRVDPTGAGSPAFRKNHQVLTLMEKIHTLLHDLLHLFPITPTTDRDALIDIAEKRQQEIALEIRPFRQIPGQQIVLQDTAMQGKQGIGQNHRINHGQVIGTDHPGTFMLFE
jgi:hypothetical protein